MEASDELTVRIGDKDSHVHAIDVDVNVRRSLNSLLRKSWRRQHTGACEKEGTTEYGAKQHGQNWHGRTASKKTEALPTLGFHNAERS